MTSSTTSHNSTSKGLHIFLGGQDLEMHTIATMLTDANQPYDDAKLGWGAAASSYAERIQQVVAAGKTPVLVELDVDIPLPGTAIIVDHHGDQSHKPASILQLGELLNIPLTREHQLIAANDAGYVPAMRAMGATTEEIADIRQRDRAAQGITPEQEAQAAEAVAQSAHSPYRYPEGMVVVHCPHSKTAPIADRFAMQPSDSPRVLLILSQDGEANLYAPGDVVQTMGQQFPERSWTGGQGLGDPNGRGFFGMQGDSKSNAAIHAATVATVMLAQGAKAADIIGMGPWVNPMHPEQTQPSDGGFIAVDIAHATASTVPVALWAQAGGSFTNVTRGADSTPAHEQGRGPVASEGEAQAHPHKDGGYTAADHARMIGADSSVRKAVRTAVVQEAARTSLDAHTPTTPNPNKARKTDQDER